MPEAAPTAAVDAALQARWPEAACELYARDPWELLAATILLPGTSAAQVNRLMAHLAEHLVGVAAWAALDHRDLARVLRPLPLAAAKARALVEAARALHERHRGRVPDDADAFARLPGVGRTVAAAVLGDAFGHPAVAATAELRRCLGRWGWTAGGAGERAAQRAVEARLPPVRWVRFGHQVARLAREHCRRGEARCAGCPLAPCCPGALPR